MINVPHNCEKCGENLNADYYETVNVIVEYDAVDEELIVKCGRCGYLVSCDPDDKLREITDNE